MPPIRPALTLFATIVALSPAAAARAAGSSLTPNPPVPLPEGTSTTSTSTSTTTSTTMTSTTMTSTTTTTTATTAEQTGAIPRTGENLPEQLLLAGVMMAGGAALRTRRPAHRE